jgi:hypothetical protein
MAVTQCPSCGYVQDDHIGDQIITQDPYPKRTCLLCIRMQAAVNHALGACLGALSRHAAEAAKEIRAAGQQKP